MQNQAAECPRPADSVRFPSDFPRPDLSTPEEGGVVIDLLDPSLEDHPEAWTW